MVYGIPAELRYEADLAAYYESLGIGAVESVVICRKWGRLKEAVERRAYFLFRLGTNLLGRLIVQPIESVYAQVMALAKKNAGRSGMYRQRRPSAAEEAQHLLHQQEILRGDINNPADYFNVDEEESVANDIFRIRFTDDDDPTDASIFEIMSRCGSPCFRNVQA